MGQKVHPNGMRVGVIRDWNTRWYASKKDFADYLICCTCYRFYRLQQGGRKDICP